MATNLAKSLSYVIMRVQSAWQIYNPVEHSRTKHIAIRYHFLRDRQQRGISRLLMLAPKNN
jgi:hypothetical protein